MLLSMAFTTTHGLMYQDQTPSGESTGGALLVCRGLVKVLVSPTMVFLLLSAFIACMKYLFIEKKMARRG